MTYLRLDPDPLRPPEDEPRWGPSRRWRLWWRFGFGPILFVLRLLPISEWRRGVWAQRIDFWAMDHLR